MDPITAIANALGAIVPVAINAAGKDKQLERDKRAGGIPELKNWFQPKTADTSASNTNLYIVLGIIAFIVIIVILVIGFSK